MEYDFFISYARADKLVVDQFARTLMNMQHSVWIDMIGSGVGDHFKKDIVEAILSSHVILFFSSAAARESKYVTNEIGVAVKHDKTVLPILLDGSHYNPQVELDLVNVNHESYYLANRNEQKFNKLIKAICKKLEQVKPAPTEETATSPEGGETLPPPPPPPPPIPQVTKFVQNFNPLTVSRTFYANFVEAGLNIQGGKIIIEEDTLIFKAHIFNFGDTRERKWDIHHICGYKKEFPNFLNIYFDNAKAYKFSFWNRNEVKKILEERRKNYYKSNGLLTPPLQFDQ